MNASNPFIIRDERGRERTLVLVEVSLDPVPGTFHTKESAEECVQAILRESIPHYNPEVVTSPTMAPAAMEGLTKTMDMLANSPGEFLGMLSGLLDSDLGKEVASGLADAAKDTFRQPGEERAPDFPPGPIDLDKFAKDDAEALGLTQEEYERHLHNDTLPKEGDDAAAGS